VGFLARSVADLQRILGVTSGTREAFAMPGRCAWFVDDVDPEVAATVEAGASALRGLGFEAADACPPRFADAASLLAELRAGEGLPEIEWLSRGRMDELSPLVQAELRSEPPPSRAALAGDIEQVRAGVLEFLGSWQILLMPVAATPAFPIVKGPQPPRAQLDVCTRAVTLLRLPAAVVPCGTSRGGLPIGLQLAGRPGHDEQVLLVASLLEEIFGRWRPTYPKRTDG
jgi:Asp-tRNA(Asn)/Glu-tRNA(Gln) amidotransferase A subunit family amidase